MANIESIKTDLQKEVEGVWVNFVGIDLLIARARNSKYQEVLKKLVNPVRKDIREDKLEIEDFNKILDEVRAKTVLLDWKNLQDDEGKDIPYSSEMALKFFRDPELKDFYKFVIAVSENADQYLKNLIKDSEKN